jgi:hypothetical protein
VAKKKRAKKTTKKTTLTVTHIFFDGSTKEDEVHIGETGSAVVLSAIGTDVTLQFTGLSPLKGVKKSITIKADHAKVRRVQASKGDYEYSLKFGKKLTPQGLPEMIVP